MKNKAYYVTQGSLYASGKTIEVDSDKLADINNQSWQAKSFRSGISEKSWDVPHETLDTGKLAIESHLQCLVEDWKRESLTKPYGSKLGNRLYGKIKYLCKKHKLDHVEIFNNVDWPVAV